MTSISEKSYDEKTTIKTISHFYTQYRLGARLKKAGAYKQKGIPVARIIQYLIALIYTGKSMFQDMRSSTPLAQGFSKDTVYRLLNHPSINWYELLLALAVKVVCEFKRLSSVDRLCALVIDDTMYQIPYAKKSELVSKIYDHAEKGKNKYKWGFRLLTLGWTDGVSFTPLSFRHLASAKKENQRCGVKSGLDKRSRAYSIRREAVTKATDVMLTQLEAAVKTGIAARHVLFDSWFAFPVTITKICSMGLHVVARIKNTTTIKYLVDGEKKTAQEIFRANKKRRGRSRYLLSVPITVYSTVDDAETALPAKLVYVRNKKNRKDWIALLSTDMSLSEEDIIALYGKRWDIEVFFKICKSYLRLTGEFHQISYDALVAHTTIVMIRYIILSLKKRNEEDPRSLGELFYVSYDEVSDIKFEQSFLIIMTILADTLRNEEQGLTETQIEQILDYFIQKLPPYIRTCLPKQKAA